MKPLIPSENAHELIYLIRGQKVMLDRDLATLYKVTTFNLNKAVKRNRERFPPDFMFQLTRNEYAALRFQSGILKRGEHSKYLPYVFTEQGVAMLSGVLRSKRASLINIMIMRAFVKLRQMIAAHKELAHSLAALERRLAGHDGDIQHIYRIIQNWEPPAKIGRIGYKGGA